MEEIRCVLEEAQEEPDVKLKIVECPVEEEDEHEEESGGGDDEEKNCGGGDTVGEDSDDDVGGWDENGDLCLPFIGSWDPPVLVCTAGASCSKERAEEIISLAEERNHELMREWCEMMMQVFSLRLSNPIDHPVDIYGSFSVRDGWEPLPNYLFKRSRDDPAMIPESWSFLPLRSPCRGIYVLQYCLIDVDLWIKEEGDGSADKQLGFETAIEVLAEAGHVSHLKFSASTSSFDDEIPLYDGAFCGSGVKDELHIVLKMDGSQYKWTFKAGVGVVVAPEHPVPGFSQYFVMNVSFRTRGKAASGWQWSCICNVVSTKVYL
ncbi:hypothetical protein PVAP13_5KG546107 [Panicum virgatum]|uniref:DUF6598 domain-containing protein n=1 Tax=Panicum virgatum TaxID=38727 RepID=A0A8T0SUQ1_PANVG|nr:hypothetical protein PVAP13_5KG546107 [Panicum virgatum]